MRRDLFAWSTRLGYAIYGLLYIAIGGLALLAALGSAGMTFGTREALRALILEPAGLLAVGVLTAGFTSHALWRFAQALMDADRKGRKAAGLASRGGKLLGALGSAALAIYGLSLLFGWGADVEIGDGGRGDWLAWLLHRAPGRWLIGAVGSAVLSGGVVQTLSSARRDFRRDFDMGGGAIRLAAPVMRFGLVMRGLVNVAVGVSVVLAAVRVNVAAVRSLGELFDLLQRQTYGAPVLGFMGIGLIAFGVSNLAHSLWRRIDGGGPVGDRSGQPAS